MEKRLNVLMLHLKKKNIIYIYIYIYIYVFHIIYLYSIPLCPFSDERSDDFLVL